MADIDGEDVPRFVHCNEITQRVKLPWKPADLHDYFITFRRRDAEKDDYIEDLRVRRNFITGILKLLTLKGNWRPHQGEEPLHKWYTGFEWLSDAEIEECFPLDDVPEGLHIESLDETEATNVAMNVDIFTLWLNEGRHDCEVAPTLLHLWIHTLAASKHDTLYDFFQQLLEEFKTESAEHKDHTTHIRRFILALQQSQKKFALRSCNVFTKKWLNYRRTVRFGNLPQGM